MNFKKKSRNNTDLHPGNMGSAISFTADELEKLESIGTKIENDSNPCYMSYKKHTAQFYEGEKIENALVFVKQVIQRTFIKNALLLEEENSDFKKRAQEAEVQGNLRKMMSLSSKGLCMTDKRTEIRRIEARTSKNAKLVSKKDTESQNRFQEWNTSRLENRWETPSSEVGKVDARRAQEKLGEDYVHVDLP